MNFMDLEYLHPKKRNGEAIYNEQLIKWLVSRGFMPSRKEARILDLASGKGHFYFALKRMGYQNIYAVDLCPQFKECKKGDITRKLPYNSDFFDLVISRDIAEHISQSDKFFNEQKRILKKGGVVIVMTPNAENLSIGEFYDDYTHCMPYTRKSLYEALTMHGFRKIFVTRVRAIPRLWLITPKAFDFLFSLRKNNLLAVAKK